MGYESICQKLLQKFITPYIIGLTYFAAAVALGQMRECGSFGSCGNTMLHYLPACRWTQILQLKNTLYDMCPCGNALLHCTHTLSLSSSLSLSLSLSLSRLPLSRPLSQRQRWSTMMPGPWNLSHAHPHPHPHTLSARAEEGVREGREGATPANTGTRLLRA